MALPLLPAHLVLWVSALLLASSLATDPDPNLTAPVQGTIRSATHSADVQHGAYTWAIAYDYTGPAGEAARGTTTLFRDRQLPELHPGDPITVEPQGQFDLPRFLLWLIGLGGLELLAVNWVARRWSERRSGTRG